MDSQGNIIVPCVYDMVVLAFNDLGLARVSKNNKMGFVAKNGNLVIRCKYENAGDFVEGLSNVRLNDKWGFIDAKGKTVVDHKYDFVSSFSDGMARVAKREGNVRYYGFINKAGKEVIPLIYADAHDFHKGFAKVLKNGKWIEINKSGAIRE